MEQLRDWIEAPYPETMQIYGDTEVVRDVLGRVLAMAKGKGFLTGRVDLLAVERSLGPRTPGLGLDAVFQDWALKGTANAKFVSWFSSQAPSRAPALMLVDAIEYPGPEHLIDIKKRIRALNNQIGELRLWILFACDPNTPDDNVASQLATGRLYVVK